MFFGALKSKGFVEEEPGVKEAKAPEIKSASSEEFLRTPEAKEFIKKWTSPKKKEEPKFKRRGVTELLRNLHQISGLDSNKKILNKGDEVLSLLGGMDGLEKVLSVFKVKSEGILKAIKTVLKA